VRVAEDCKKEGLIEFALLAKPDSAGAVHPLSKLCKKIANRKAAIIQHVMQRTRKEIRIQFQVLEG